MLIYKPSLLDVEDVPLTVLGINGLHLITLGLIIFLANLFHPFLFIVVVVN